jgi:hypothetical protein
MTIFFAAGAAAGLYFRAFVLIVPILATLAIAVGTFLDGHSLGFAGIVFLSAAISCQAGYLAGGLARTSISPARAGTRADNHRTTASRPYSAARAYAARSRRRDNHAFHVIAVIQPVEPPTKAPPITSLRK